ncbi:MAG: hypothetical protein WDW38_004069 [Sanguina aurantia]
MSSSHSPLAAGGEDTCQVAARRDTAQRSTTQPRAAHRSPPQPAASAADATCRDKVASIAHLAMQAPLLPAADHPFTTAPSPQTLSSLQGPSHCTVLGSSMH